MRGGDVVGLRAILDSSGPTLCLDFEYFQNTPYVVRDKEGRPVQLTTEVSDTPLTYAVRCV